MKFIVPVLVFVLIVLGGWLYFRESGSSPKPTEQTVTTVTNGVQVTKTDISKSGSKLPEGFPEDIPVEAANIKDSYRAYYEKVKATQYTVSYVSKLSKDTLWKTYSDFMNGEDFKVDPTSSRSIGQISGVKGDDSMSVVITANAGVTLVQIVYLDR